ncbi:alpha/beta hydrolase [Streptomyces sp. NPDC098789]|uniref:alpha/beta hydrolase n=1 Tax=Streptomyces sp. NPDC098789 TaxID=3366098 RepID=UPI00381391AC
MPQGQYADAQPSHSRGRRSVQQPVVPSAPDLSLAPDASLEWDDLVPVGATAALGAWAGRGRELSGAPSAPPADLMPQTGGVLSGAPSAPPAHVMPGAAEDAAPGGCGPRTFDAVNTAHQGEMEADLARARAQADPTGVPAGTSRGRFAQDVLEVAGEVASLALEAFGGEVGLPQDAFGDVASVINGSYDGIHPSRYLSRALRTGTSPMAQNLWHALGDPGTAALTNVLRTGDKAALTDFLRTRGKAVLADLLRVEEKPAVQGLRENNAASLKKALAVAEGLPCHVLAYEPEFEGVGRMAVALGNIETAAHVAILVPGMGSSPTGFDGLVERARVVYDECGNVGPGADVAVIAWQGYKAPRDIRKGKFEVGDDDPAKSGSRLLNADLAAWRGLWKSSTARKDSGLPENPRIIINGYSYGSVVAGYALMRPTLPGGFTDVAKGAVNGVVREVGRTVTGVLVIPDIVKSRMQDDLWKDTVLKCVKNVSTVGSVALAAGGDGQSALTAVGKIGKPILKRAVMKAYDAYRSEALGGGKADEVVFFGSPGTGRRAKHLDISPQHIYVAAHTDDWVSKLAYFSIDPAATNYDPTHQVVRLKSSYVKTATSSWTDPHESYYDPATDTEPARESLTNLARIITGNSHQVTRQPKRPGGSKNPIARLVTNPPTNAPVPGREPQSSEKSADATGNGTKSGRGRRGKRSLGDAGASGGTDGFEPVATTETDPFAVIDPLLREIVVSSDEKARSVAKIDRTIRTALEAESGSADARTVSLDTRVTALYRRTLQIDNLVDPSGGGGQTRTFTLRQVMLGEMDRENDLTSSGWSRVLVTPPSSLSAGLWRAVRSKTTRQQVGNTILDDALALVDTPETKASYLSYARDRVTGALAKLFTSLVDGSRESDATGAAMAGEHPPQLVIFNKEVVPNLVAFPCGEDKLIVSVATGEVKVLAPMFHSTDWERFVRGHLSAYESGRASSSDFRPKTARLGGLGGVSREIRYVPFTFRESGSVYEDLWGAGLTKVRKEADSLSYTPEEQRRDEGLRFKRDLATAVSNLATLAAVGLTGGAALAVSLLAGGAGIGATVFQDQLGGVADRGDVRRRTEDDAALGRVFAIGGTLLDLAAAAKFVRAAAPGAKTAATKQLRSVIAKGQEKILARRIAGNIDGGLRAKAPMERTSAYASAIAANQDLPTAAFRHGDECWDAAIRVDELAGVISPAEAKRLRSVTRAKEFGAFLGGNDMKAVANPESLARIPAGERVAIVSGTGRDRTMLHAMTSTGNGKAAGLNNAGINSRLGSGYAEFDLAADAGVTFRGDGVWELADGQRVRVYVHADAPEFRIESLRPRTAVPELTEADKLLSNRLLKACNRDAGISEMMASPKEKCAALMDKAAALATHRKFTDIRYVGMDMWANAGPETFASNHFVVIGRKGGKDWVFDLSAGQFADKGMQGIDGPLVLPLENWLEKYRRSTTTKVIKMREFSNSQSATTEFHPGKFDLATDYREGLQLLTRPAWFDRGIALRVADRTVRVSVTAAKVPKAAVTRVVGGVPTVTPVADQLAGTVDVVFPGFVGEVAELLLHPKVRFQLKYAGRVIKCVLAPKRDTTVVLRGSNGTVLEVGGEQTRSVELPARTGISLEVFPTRTTAIGDTLRSVAQTELGDGERWREIYELNRTAIGTLSPGGEMAPATVRQVWRIPESAAEANRAKLLTQILPRLNDPAFHDEVNEAGDSSWAAVAGLQHTTGIIDDTEMNRLVRATSAQDFTDFLDGEGREIATENDFGRLKKGYRLAFIQVDGNRQEMIHAMLSLGGGELIGVHNGVLKTGLPDPLACVYPMDDGGGSPGGALEFTDEGARLFDGRQVLVMAESGALFESRAGGRNRRAATDSDSARLARGDSASRGLFTQLTRGADSLEVRKLRSRQYFDNTIRDVTTKVTKESAAEAMPLDGKWTCKVNVPVTHQTVATNGGASSHQWQVTTRDLALGEPQRKNPTIWSRSRIDLTPPAGLSPRIVDALKGTSVRDGVAARLKADATDVLDGDAFQKSFKEFTGSRLRGTLARIFAAPGTDPSSRMFARSWLGGHLKERLVELNGKVIPGMVSLGVFNEHLLVSLETGKHHYWRWSDSGGSYEPFIREHLSRFENDAAKAKDFRPGRTGGGEAVGALKMQPTDDSSTGLWRAARDRMLSDLDGLVYTSGEHAGEVAARTKRDLMMALALVTLPLTIGTAGGISSAISLGTGVGFGFAEAHYEEQIAGNADRGNVYREAMEDAALGRILAGAGGVLDALFILKAMKAAKLKVAALRAKPRPAATAVNTAEQALDVRKAVTEPRRAKVPPSATSAGDLTKETQALNDVGNFQAAAERAQQRALAGGADELMGKMVYEDMRSMLHKLSNAVKSPRAKCYEIMGPVREYMFSQGFTNFRYRGMGIWQKGDKVPANNHFVVLGDLGDQTWAADFTAHQFPNISGPIFKPEPVWARTWQETTDMKLIKYRDFQSMPEADHMFNSTVPLGPFDTIDDATVLVTPPWAS